MKEHSLRKIRRQRRRYRFDIYSRVANETGVDRTTVKFAALSLLYRPDAPENFTELKKELKKMVLLGRKLF